MKSISRNFLFSIIIISIFLGSCANQSGSSSNSSSSSSGSNSDTDKKAPELLEIQSVRNPTNNTTPSYSFSSTEKGTISYGGGCQSDITSADNTTNIIEFKTLSEGTYDECWLAVTDKAGNRSENIDKFF